VSRHLRLAHTHARLALAALASPLRRRLAWPHMQARACPHYMHYACTVTTRTSTRARPPRMHLHAHTHAHTSTHRHHHPLPPQVLCLLHPEVGATQGRRRQPSLVPPVQGAIQLPVRAPAAGWGCHGCADGGERVPAQVRHLVHGAPAGECVLLLLGSYPLRRSTSPRCEHAPLPLLTHLSMRAVGRGAGG